MYPTDRIENTLKEMLTASLKANIESGDFVEFELPEIGLEIPREASHGEYATNLAMVLAKTLRMNPRMAAQKIIEKMPENPLVSAVEMAGPGFLNFRLDQSWLYGLIDTVFEMQDRFGSVEDGGGKRIQVEFVSANPTGPMHMGNAKGGAIGDSLANVLKFAGYNAWKEFYVNDAGNQVVKFGDSLEARYQQLMGNDVEIPEGGYHGDDVKEHVENILKENPDVDYAAMTPEERKKIFSDYALEKNIAKMKADLKRFGVEFDMWYRESTLHNSGKVNETVEVLNSRGHIYEKDGAKWFKASEFGDEKDAVMIRSNGISTYYAADIAYHKDKFDRGFEEVVDILGADHHGHMARMKGSMRALGYDENKLNFIIMQLVRLMRGGEVVRMSKRTGKSISLTDLIDEVGLDAARFIFNMKSPDAHTNFDMELAVKQSNDNPVFYVQYAHARIASILRQTADFQMKELPYRGQELLTSETEIALIKKLADFPREIRVAAKLRAPHRITNYVIELAAAFHGFYNSNRVIVEDENLMTARLNLIAATKIALKNGMTLLGVSAPEQM